MEDMFDLDNAVQTQAEFSFSIAVMDKIGGWEEGAEQENCVGAEFVASIWIFSTAVVCNGQSHMQKLADLQIEICCGCFQLGVR